MFGNTTNPNNHIRRIHAVEYRTLTTADDSPAAIIIDDPQPGSSSGTYQPSAEQEHQQQQQDIGEPASKRQRHQRQLKLFGVETKTGLSDDDRNELDSYIVEMVVTDYQPLSFVENAGFLKYSKKMNTLYKPPGRKMLTKKNTAHCIRKSSNGNEDNVKQR